MTSIRIVEVDKSFGAVKALRKVSLQVEPGELFTLLGPSGCGKTTLLRTVAGFHRQDSGDILLGDELVNDTPAHRRDTGMVFQNYAVFPHMTVFENVAYGLRVRRVRGAEITRRVEAALKLVRLEGYGARTPDQLSGGQQQRVGLARAMAIEPRVLLLDEPLSNLDAKLRVEMRGEVRDIQKQLGITALYVTHDQEEALAISDRIAVVEGGVIQQVGAPWAIYKEPCNLFVATFVGTMNRMEGRIVGPAGPGLIEVAAGDLTLRVASPGREPAGRRIILGFRPEDARVNPPSDAVNRIEAPVRSASFLGSTATLLLDLAGTAVVVESHRPESMDVVRVGGTAVISVAPASFLLFDPDTGSRIPMGAAS